MHRHFIKIILVSLTVILTGCSGFFEKDNTPPPHELINFKPRLQPQLRWSRQLSAIDDEFLRMGPTYSNGIIYTAGTSGTVTAIDARNGQPVWQTATGVLLATGAGVGHGLIVIGGRGGELVALSAQSGKVLWKKTVLGEILAKPAVGDYIVVKCIDGYVRALHPSDGHTVWTIAQLEPSLILRGASAPLMIGENLIAGFANGNMIKVDARTGEILWLQSIALPEGAFNIERMIDIDADPILFNHHLYAATYQGKIASLAWLSGSINWQRDISSYTGMQADRTAVYISDAKSYLWAFAADDGQVRWKQELLADRGITAPALLDSYLVVGDKEGFLHWLNKNDGSFAARTPLNGSVVAAPIVHNGVLYVLTNKGNLSAFTLRGN